MLFALREMQEEARRTREEDKIDNWPIMGSVVPEEELGFVEKWRLEDAVELAISLVRQRIAELHIRDPLYVDEEEGVQFRFLIETMLKHSRTVEQIENMVNGYIAFCVRECGQSEFRSSALSEMRHDFDVATIDMSCFGPKKMAILEEDFGPQKFRTLNKHGRNEILDTVSHGLAEGPIRRYSGEPFYDGAYMLMADPAKVYHNGIYGNELIERRTPEAKRMTKAKLARLLQMPEIEDCIIADRMMPGPCIGSSLAISAEYFCETDDAIYLNSIDPKNIGEWLSDKFRIHNPPLEVAFYVWARFQQTEFEEEAGFIEGYIFKILKLLLAGNLC